MFKNKSEYSYNILKASIFELFVKDIHIHINFLSKKLQSMYDRLAVQVPDNILNEIKIVLNNSNSEIREKNLIKNSNKTAHMQEKIKSKTHLFSTNFT